jgi:tRNA (guanine37-N1)-methyltransferase
MTIRFDLLSLFPEYFQGPFDCSIIHQAIRKGIVEINFTNIRDFALDKHRKVDDRPFGGGPGMVMKPDPICAAIDTVATEQSYVVYMSPQGKVLNAKKCRELAQKEHLVILCGHYEGVDERALSRVDEEISIGDYVLTNGCLAAIVLIDSVSRFVPGVLGHELAAAEDSFENRLLDHPHYTQPVVFEGVEVPAVLRSGNHKEIREWRLSKALEKTRAVRPDLISNTPRDQEQIP